MTFRDELIEILRQDALGGYTKDVDGNFVPLDWSGTPDSFFEDTVTSIINLVDKEVITAPLKYSADLDGYSDVEMDTIDVLRETQRAIIRKEK